ncbi:helix-turn-helix transcriptional regulator [Lactiplantibacillus sp. DA1]|uniref:helix-turn-helix domain-containing protein n=1 Tax=Lactiplantibacillus sp. DA1 TaxID=3079857 RepID=UPI00292A5F44|nr:helix-turn-helix transcriptional regulator [Lactiplantibacillus sp. DA1]MDV0430426.1 helix-turn-helix transcriptional regulator [Lactiplantibacillus sp. DA1]
MSLGTTLKQARKAQRLNQQQAAQGICAQSMLSAIENDHYVPNARLLLALCRRLGVAVSTLSLADDFEISADLAFNARVQQICNAHQYQQLKNWLLQPAALEHVQTDEQTQAYYYYLGVACWQVDRTSDVAQQNLRLAIGMAASNTPLTTLTRLALISLAVVKASHHPQAKVTTLVTRALTGIDEGAYAENDNIVFYLAGLVAYEQHDTQLALTRLTQGLAFATTHNSHYMLANIYQLMAQLAMLAGESATAQVASQRSQVFKDLFKEQVNDRL